MLWACTLVQLYKAWYVVRFFVGFNSPKLRKVTFESLWILSTQFLSIDGALNLSMVHCVVYICSVNGPWNSNTNAQRLKFANGNSIFVRIVIFQLQFLQSSSNVYFQADGLLRNCRGKYFETSPLKAWIFKEMRELFLKEKDLRIKNLKIMFLPLKREFQVRGGFPPVH